MTYHAGMLVENTGAPEWGPGKIVHVAGDKLHIVFRDLEEQMARQFRADSPALRICTVQSDPVLDNLPPLEEKDGRWYLPAKRLTLDALKRRFLHEFPAGFADPKYLTSERDYKLTANIKFKQHLGVQRTRELLQEQEYRTLATKAGQVLGAINLISPYESAALHDAMQDDGAVRRFFTALLAVLDARPFHPDTFEAYLDEVHALPAVRGKVATWPVATIFPYLADPDQFMFLKPEVTQEAAVSLGFDLKYKPAPNMDTYAALLRMGRVYLELLRPLGARDFIDVQSFIYVSCGGYDKEKAKASGQR